MAKFSLIARRMLLVAPTSPGNARNWNRPSPIVQLREAVLLKPRAAVAPEHTTTTWNRGTSHEEPTGRHGDAATGRKNDGKAQPTRISEKVGSDRGQQG